MRTCHLMGRSCLADTAQEKTTRCLDSSCLDYTLWELLGPEGNKKFPSGKVNSHSRVRTATRRCKILQDKAWVQPTR